MRITSIRCQALIGRSKAAASCDTAQDNAVVRVVADNGLEGIGEVEANPWVIKACIEAPGTHSFDRSLAELLVGRDASDPVGLWDYLYERTILTGRRGAGICALGAVDVALWDLLGKALRRPVWQILGERMKDLKPRAPFPVFPYASVLPVGDTLGAFRNSMLAKARWACGQGFRAVKLEIMVNGPYAVNGLREDDGAIVELVRLGREALGPKVGLMVDVGYCWKDWRQAARVLRQVEDCNLMFLETPLPPDDLEGYARLAKATSIPLAAGELLQTRFEFEELIERGKVPVVQPDVGRVGGLTEAMRVVEMAAARGLSVVPHCWRSGLGIAATAHLAAASGHCSYVEYLPVELSESPLRKRMLKRELVYSRGRLRLNGSPGLGVELSERCLAMRADPAGGVAEAPRVWLPTWRPHTRPGFGVGRSASKWDSA